MAMLNNQRVYLPSSKAPVGLCTSAQHPTYYPSHQTGSRWTVAHPAAPPGLTRWLMGPWLDPNGTSPKSGGYWWMKPCRNMLRPPSDFKLESNLPGDTRSTWPWREGSVKKTLPRPSIPSALREFVGAQHRCHGPLGPHSTAADLYAHPPCAHAKSPQQTPAAAFKARAMMENGGFGLHQRVISMGKIMANQCESYGILGVPSSNLT